MRCLSHSQYYGELGHIKSGHRILYIVITLSALLKSSYRIHVLWGYQKSCPEFLWKFGIGKHLDHQIAYEGSSPLVKKPYRPCLFGVLWALSLPWRPRGLSNYFVPLYFKAGMGCSSKVVLATSR